MIATFKTLGCEYDSDLHGVSRWLYRIAGEHGEIVTADDDEQYEDGDYNVPDDFFEQFVDDGDEYDW